MPRPSDLARDNARSAFLMRASASLPSSGASEMKGVARDLVRHPDGVADAGRNGGRVAGSGNVAQGNGKLIAADARHKIIVADVGAQALAHGPQQLVADRMAQ